MSGSGSAYFGICRNGKHAAWRPMQSGVGVKVESFASIGGHRPACLIQSEPKLEECGRGDH